MNLAGSDARFGLAVEGALGCMLSHYESIVGFLLLSGAGMHTTIHLSFVSQYLLQPFHARKLA